MASAFAKALADTSVPSQIDFLCCLPEPGTNGKFRSTRVFICNFVLLRYLNGLSFRRDIV